MTDMTAPSGSASEPPATPRKPSAFVAWMRTVWTNPVVIFFAKRVIWARTLPILALLFFTVNAFGWSYMHLVANWGTWFWQRTPRVPDELQAQFLLFVGATIAILFAYAFSLHWKRCESFFQSVLWRGVITVSLSFVVLNPWMSYGTWALYWKDTLLPQWPWGLSFWGGAGLAGTVLVGLALALLWNYIGKKAWQGVGSSKLTAALVPLLIGAFIWFIWMLGLFPANGRWAFTIVQTLIGVSVGICFSLTLIDRFLSGTVGSTTTIKEIDADSGAPHGEDHAQDATQAEAVDEAATHR